MQRMYCLPKVRQPANAEAFFGCEAVLYQMICHAPLHLFMQPAVILLYLTICSSEGIALIAILASDCSLHSGHRCSLHIAADNANEQLTSASLQWRVWNGKFQASKLKQADGC